MLRPLLVATMLAAAPCATASQVATGAADTLIAVADASDVLGQARSAQASFERRRLSFLPITLGTPGGTCDEHVGRFCSWFDEGDWYPVPERPEIAALRAELLSLLDSAQRVLPGDGWVLGQRVWYLGEATRWRDALAAATTCGGVEPWWCNALEGLALHELGDFLAAEDAFNRALVLMDGEDALRWRLPQWTIDSDGRGIMKALETAPADSVARVLGRMWTLADPLYLVPGNDRLTAHYARWTVATLRERARNPFHITWGRDLDQLVVRHGWELGWERAPNRDITALDNVVGHKHPQGRDFMPPGSALTAPGLATASALEPNRTRPRSLYAPSYAPVFLPMDAQVSAFPRGERMLVVATHALPEDTTVSLGPGRVMPWMEPGTQAGSLDRAGLFVTEIAGGGTRAVRAFERTDGVLMVEAPTAPSIVSVESWSPQRRRAGRLRVALDRSPAPEDIPVVSDLLVLDPMEPEPESIEQVLPHALASLRVVRDQRIAIAWEVSGLGFRPETLAFEVRVTRTNRSVARRIGEFLRIVGTPDIPGIAWTEPAPNRPGIHFGYLTLDLPDLDPADYVVTLTLRTSGRSEVLSSRVITVTEGR